MSITSFVDDIGEFLVADTVPEAHEKSVSNTDKLVKHLAKVGCALEPTKEVVVARWMGNKAHNKVREYMKPDVVSSGAKEKTARYLGAWPQDNNKLNTEIQKRCAAMLTGCYAFVCVGGNNKLPFVLVL